MKSNGENILQNHSHVRVTVRVIITLTVFVLAIGGWFLAYHNRKSLDNIPSLALVVQEGEHEKLQGYHREQLLEIWGEPVETGSNEDIWTVGPGSALVRVNYNWQDEVVAVGVMPAVSETSD